MPKYIFLAVNSSIRPIIQSISICSCYTKYSKNSWVKIRCQFSDHLTKSIHNYFRVSKFSLQIIFSSTSTTELNMVIQWTFMLSLLLTTCEKMEKSFWITFLHSQKSNHNIKQFSELSLIPKINQHSSKKVFW